MRTKGSHRQFHHPTKGGTVTVSGEPSVDYFCGVCGIYTHHQRRSSPNEYGYNVGCLEGINPLLLPDVPVNDGVNHPADREAPANNSRQRTVLARRR